MPPDAWRPTFVRLRPGERPELERACRAAGIEVVDTLTRQFDDLAAALLPAGTGDEHRAFVEERVVAAGDIDACGTRVWIPWERRLVHLLDEEVEPFVDHLDLDELTAAPPSPTGFTTQP